ncbi:oxidoreductase [Neobacillus kokaensis]|uniref:Short-chain dehydrogenase/reductase n=1 Tax=Neobacillus kokaensis TaxID=2759023 RepID=A0ABQ3MX47_9BACI|nr:oxidoreductase [Neobacillus kokaensis]GHH96819.1 short-chain dehydrogenase/reductase [Neobacillus kokaensis]
MNQPTAIVTGASGGFGLLTTMELAKSGFKVVATMRNLEKSINLLTEAKKYNQETNITLHELDVTSEVSINKFQSFLETVERVDVLVNNAGYAAGGFVEEVPLDEYRKQFETNVFGVIAVTKTVLPYMRKQKSGKIINVSSISGKVAFPGLSPYCASKHALEGWSESLRLEMKPFGVDVVLVEPGSFKTNIWSTGRQVTPSQTESPYFEHMQKLENYILSGESGHGDPVTVAKKIAAIARMKKPTLRFSIGKGVGMTILLKNLIPWNQWEAVVLKTLNKTKS